MPKTHSDSTNNRVNPYITKSISKTLLTPCRQVGLSRKKKTPNSSLRTSSAGSPVVLNTTPVTSRQSSSDSPDPSQETKSPVKPDKSSDKVKTKKLVAKCLIVDDKDDASVISSKASDSSDKINDKSGSKCVIVDDDDDDSGFVGFKRENSSEKASQKTVKSSNKKKVKKSGSKRVIVDDEDERESDKAKIKKSVSKRLIIEDDDEDDMNLASLKRNDPSEKIASDSDFDTSNTFCHVPVKPKDKLRQYENKAKKKKTVLTEIQNGTPTPVITEELKEKPVGKAINENMTKPEKKVKMKRSLSMKKSTEEPENNRPNSEDSVTQDCTVILSPLDPVSISETSINKLEQEVQEKMKLLEELQQAEIYRKLHDVGKLQELTATWKTGCIAALTDLLPHLQAHANMDMATLLSNLRVPENLITLSQSGDLI